MTKRRFNTFNFFNLSVFWFAISFHWGAILGIFLQKQVLNFVPPDLKGFYYSILAGTGALVAGLVQVVIGHISDEFRSKWGRRMPFIFWGVVLNTGALLFMGWSKSFASLVISFAAVQLFANIANGPFQALIPDMVPEDQQGTASAWMGIFMYIGQAAGPVFAGFLMTRAGAGIDLMIFIALLMNLLMLYTVAFVKEPEIEENNNSKKEKSNPIKEIFSFSLHKYPDYTWILVSRTLVNMGFYTALGFLMYFIKDSLMMKDYEKTTGLLIMVITAAGILSAFPAGILADRFSKKTIIYISGGFTALAALLFVFSPNITMTMISGFILGAGYGTFATVDWALVCNYIPGGKAGKYMGIWNLTFALPQIFAPLIAGYPSDFINKTWGAGTGYRAVLLLVVVYMVLGILAVKPVNEKENGKISNPRLEVEGGI